MKYSVQLVVLNDDGEVLAVSRKDDHNDFGLIGGKVDEGENLIEAMIRETKEETGLLIHEHNLELVFVMHKYGNMGYTYYTKSVCGKVQTDENHVVKWTTFDEIIKGGFGRWNKLVAESLIDMGIKLKYNEKDN